MMAKIHNHYLRCFECITFTTIVIGFDCGSDIKDCFVSSLEADSLSLIG